MASYTTNYGFVMPTPNSSLDANRWGAQLNANLTSPLDTYLLATALSNIGTTAPTIPNGSPMQGQMWINTSGTAPISSFTLNVYSGSAWVTMGTVNIATGTFVPAGTAILNSQVFTTAGTFTYTPTVGTLQAIVKMVGSGAGGGSIAGGGAGQYAEGFFSIATIGASQTIIVGTGGAPATNGNITSFGSLMQANGGITPTAPGTSTQSGFQSGGVGGSGDTIGGYFSSNGGGGSPGFYATNASQFTMNMGGNGGNSLLGGGAPGITGGSGEGTLTATAPGGGGAGWGSIGQTGGSGAPGAIIVIEYA